MHLPECKGWPFVVVRTPEAGGGARLPARDPAGHLPSEQPGEPGGCDFAGGAPGVHAHHKAARPHGGLEGHVGRAAADVGGG